MVVDHAAGLHEGVGGGGADEFPASLLELFGETGGGGGNGEGGEGRFGEFLRSLGCGRNKLPKELVEAASFFNQFAGALGVVDGGFDLAPVTDDAGIGDEAGDVFVVKISHFLEVEIGEGGAEVFALAKDGQPAETGLEAFENDFLEEKMIVVDWLGPLVVMIMPIVIKRIAPLTAGQLVRTIFKSVWKLSGNDYSPPWVGFSAGMFSAGASSAGAFSLATRSWKACILAIN